MRFFQISLAICVGSYILGLAAGVVWGFLHGLL